MKKFLPFIAIVFSMAVFSQDVAVRIENLKLNNVTVPNGSSINLGNNPSGNVTFRVDLSKRSTFVIGPAKVWISVYKSSGSRTDYEITDVPVSQFSTGASKSYNINILASDIDFGDGNYLSAILKQDNSPGTEWESQRIPIIKNPPFQLSPCPVSLSCGDTSQRTFTVTNSANLSGVTYQWSIGSGWSGNVTSNSSITLTPNNGTTLPSNISVTPIYNGIPQPILTCSVDRAPFSPSLTITGPISVCNSSTFSVNNLGTNIQVTGWSVSNPGIASISGNGNQATLTAIGNGRVTITATLKNACGQNSPISTSEIFIGTGMPRETTGFDVVGSNYHYTASGVYIKNFIVCPNEYLDITPKPYMQDVIEHQWSVTGNYHGTYNPSASVLSITTSSQVGATLQIRHRARNACGWGAWINGSFQNMDCDNGEEPWFVYPNPATETLTIESLHNPGTKEKAQSTQKPDQRYTLYDFNGTIVQRGWLNNKTTLDVTKLKKGRYVLKLEVDENKEIVRHIIIN